jgi:multiple sugar transport system substrate-binding protein
MIRRKTSICFAAATAAVAGVCLAAPPALAQSKEPVQITYATFLDPNNHNEPRAEAQTRMIALFEKEHPDIRVRVQVDSTQQEAARALRGGFATPDVFRVANINDPEFAATKAMLPLDDLIKRDNVDMQDWLLPLDAARVGGKLYGMQQDFRIPILIYRKGLLEKAAVTPPRTWDEVCVAGGKLTALGNNLVGYPVPLGISGGLGGAQALGEYLFSSMATEQTGKYFASDGRDLAVPHDQLVRVMQTLKDLYGKCKATPLASVQFGLNEVHDGLRAGTVAMATYGLFRFRAIQTGGAGDDLAWAQPPAYTPDGKMAVYGYTVAINAHSANVEAAWQFTKFMGSAQAQAISLEGGEVVARASVYGSSPYLSTPDGQRQLQWSKLIHDRGHFVGYSIIQTAFHQVIGDAAQRMILANGSPEDAAKAIENNYKAALAKAGQ